MDVQAVAIPPEMRARPAGLVRDLMTVAGRAVRAVPRDPGHLLPALVVPPFAFAVNVGALQRVGQLVGVEDFKTFQLPVAIIFGVTGLTRASALVSDIQGGYFDRLLATPMRRAPLLLGLMVADLVLALAVSTLVLSIGLLLGVDFATGALGMLVFIAFGGLWGVAFAGLPYAIALRTGNPSATNTSWLLFFPFVFLTTAFLPKKAFTPWFATITDYNPVTYILTAMRSLADGWDETALGEGFVALAAIMALFLTLAFVALHWRLRRR